MSRNKRPKSYLATNSTSLTLLEKPSRDLRNTLAPNLHAEPNVEAPPHSLKINPPLARKLSNSASSTDNRSALIKAIKFLNQFLPVGIIAIAALFTWLSGDKYFQNFLNIFLGLLIEVLPFFLIGAILAALISPLKLSNLKIWKLATRNRANATATALGMGLLLPVCECGTPSIVRQAHRAGAPAVMSLVFLLAAPILNPVTLLVTYLAFGGDWLIILGRAGLALAVALITGLILSFYPQPSDLFVKQTPNDILNEPEHDHNNEDVSFEDVNFIEDSHSTFEANPELWSPKLRALNNFLERAIEECLEAIRVGLPGIALAAAFQACVPSSYFVNLGQGVILSAIAMMVLAGLMSICSSADAFVALSFSGLLPTGAILGFLVFGPLINLKSIFLFRLVLTWRTIGLMALLCFSLILVAAVFFNYWLA